MLKKRIIFTLLWRDGTFCLSRNFKLQSVGTLAWLEKHYNFKIISTAIDELVILNVTRGEKPRARFATDVAALARTCFVPIAAGGGIRDLDDARLLLRSGADKLVVNTPLVEQPDLVTQLAGQFGRQCVMASIDYKRTGDVEAVFVRDGSERAPLPLTEAAAAAERLGAGELLVTSMDRDGTGQGYDLETLGRVAVAARVPVIASGGVGNYDHLAEWLARPESAASSTAHLFNFLGRGLAEARSHCWERGIPLARWDLEFKV